MSHPRPALTPLPSGASLVDRGTAEAGSFGHDQEAKSVETKTQECLSRPDGVVWVAGCLVGFVWKAGVQLTVLGKADWCVCACVCVCVCVCVAICGCCPALWANETSDPGIGD